MENPILEQMASLVKNFSTDSLTMESLANILVVSCKMCSQINIDEENLKMAVEEFLKKFVGENNDVVKKRKLYGIEVVEEEKNKLKEQTTQEEVEGKEEEINIFIDDSNIWIEAQRLKAQKTGLQNRIDSRVRIDISKLYEYIKQNRSINRACLYGSEPAEINFL
eukprot:TRINITY_DN23060_c0_g1_i2.p1 TRINITY_DN23060_c0_g1~~TRINITY_DN23060_c0_g1_i2.p1  ORF type:complete len:165 (+),score=23.77 TRINITY_DN23060_c0_g1_i2:55-549(+)